MIVAGTNLSMTRGDTERITVRICRSKVIVPLVAGDKVYFTVKKSINDTEKLFQKVITEFVDGIAIIDITHDDTVNAEFGEHVYDIQITYVSGAIKTVVKPAKFMILPEVTCD